MDDIFSMPGSSIDRSGTDGSAGTDGVPGKGFPLSRANDSSSFTGSALLIVDSGSFVVELSDPALEPAYSEKLDADGEVSDVIDRLPDSSRTRNWEIDGFAAPASGEEALGVDSLEMCIVGVGRSDGRINWSTLLSILYARVPNIELVPLLVLIAFGMLPGSSPSSLIS